ncbi:MULTISPECIES: amino acid ABC transporter permease [Kitasatospora]|uniref:Putative ABC transporter ATP-binding protein n=1 Tax=Kitasatospora setae (strain ATCC 33774 / DSM 43861 / JCM 3304 / KCC A-0304 / NBRC 14216 / KM-6054) TaxID=452652 RepID=E4NGX5_KITSK|nr:MULTISPECIES: amino acid ABC transporter permease [Kitasatospora]BAJ30755.1 putative ABC transporter ATP-binding protein [Kitasatospora setae KM-6054]
MASPAVPSTGLPPTSKPAAAPASTAAAAAPAAGPSAELAALPVVPRRRPWRYVSGGLALLAAGLVLRSVASNPAFEWSVVGSYLSAPSVLRGLLLTLWLTAAVVALGFALGTLLAVARLSDNPVLQSLSWGFVWLFRATPLLVQLLLWYNIGALYPTLSLSLPFGGELFSVKTVNLLGPVLTTLIGLTLHEAAFAAEVVRSGVLSVDQGQLEAASSLGLGRARVLRRIVLPQAMRAILPPAGNMLIGTLKGTAVISVLAVHDLLFSVQVIYNQTYQVIPLLLVATLWYVAVTSVLSVGQYYLERYFARGATRELPPTPWQRARTGLLRLRARTVAGR